MSNFEFAQLDEKLKNWLSEGVSELKSGLPLVVKQS